MHPSQLDVEPAMCYYIKYKTTYMHINILKTNDQMFFYHRAVTIGWTKDTHRKTTWLIYVRIIILPYMAQEKVLAYTFLIYVRVIISLYMTSKRRYWSDGSESKVYHEKDGDEMFLYRFLSNMYV